MTSTQRKWLRVSCGIVILALGIEFLSYARFRWSVQHIKVPEGAWVEYVSAPTLGKPGYRIGLLTFSADKPVEYQCVLTDVPYTGTEIDLMIGVDRSLAQPLCASDTSVKMVLVVDSKKAEAKSKVSQLRFADNRSKPELLAYDQGLLMMYPQISAGKGTIEIHFTYVPTGDLPKDRHLTLYVMSGGGK